MRSRGSRTIPKDDMSGKEKLGTHLTDTETEAERETDPARAQELPASQRCRFKEVNARPEQRVLQEERSCSRRLGGGRAFLNGRHHLG